MTTQYRIVLVRHGESEWNLENRFCGWHDADLSAKGVQEAQQAGKTLKEKGFTFDVAFTSVLKRAIKTLFLVQEELDLHWIPVTKSWRLNERMYGGLQGLNKSETAAKHGEDQVKIWRRAYDIPPPPMSDDNPELPEKDPKYKFVKKELLPRAESLKDSENRLIPFWLNDILPEIKHGKNVLVVAHGSTIRAISKTLDNISGEGIEEINIPTSYPLIYELDLNLKPIRSYYLADEETIRLAINEIVNQGKIKN